MDAPPSRGRAGTTDGSVPHNGCMSRDTTTSALNDSLGAGLDPGGTPWAELTPDRLRTRRTSAKWRRYPEDVLPMFVAEMDFSIAAEIQRAMIDRVEAGDLGYVAGAGPLAEAFAEFAKDRWGWRVQADEIHLATDVSCGIVEPLRLVLPEGARIAVTTPVYPSFFTMLAELPLEVEQLPLAISVDGGARLDLDAIERAFAGGLGAILLSNPHNPHGTVHSAEELAELARLAAQHDVFVISDEIHAPLTHRGRTFIPFAPLAAAAGALSITATSASKGWQLAGAKCSVVVAADERANRLLRRLPAEVMSRASILGLHAGVAAFRDARGWLDRAVAQIEANFRLLDALVDEHLPGVGIAPAHAGYLAWLDLRASGLGEDPAGRILRDARLALNNGAAFGAGGGGHARMNLACSPHTIVEAVERIAALPRGA